MTSTDNTETITDLRRQLADVTRERDAWRDLALQTGERLSSAAVALQRIEQGLADVRRVERAQARLEAGR